MAAKLGEGGVTAGTWRAMAVVLATDSWPSIRSRGRRGTMGAAEAARAGTAGSASGGAEVQDAAAATGLALPCAPTRAAEARLTSFSLPAWGGRTGEVVAVVAGDAAAESSTDGTAADAAGGAAAEDIVEEWVGAMVAAAGALDAVVAACV